MALTASTDRIEALRGLGARPLLGNLDQPGSLQRLAGLATRVLYLAPPPGTGRTDPRASEMTRVLRRRSRPLSLSYVSTSGVYGDCAGALVDETRPSAAGSERAQRRAAAEAQMRWLGRAGGGWGRTGVSILRVPGIYALDRPGGTPRERLLKGLPVLTPADDVYTNHIHADDLAQACLAALLRGRAQRVYNVNDDSGLRMGDYFDLAADLLGLSRPPRVSLELARSILSEASLSFMAESRRMVNHRMKRELGLRLRYPTVREGLAPAPPEVAAP